MSDVEYLAMRQRWADYRVFLREARESRHSTGAVLPSGRALAVALARYVREGRLEPSNKARTSVRGFDGLKSVLPGRRILEVGPGTGAVTTQIVRDMRPEDQLVLVERNEQFVDRLRERLNREAMFRQVAKRISVLHCSLEDLAENEPFDLIVSGLPLNNFSVGLVEQILAKLQSLTAPRGTLSFFEYVAVRRAKSLVSSWAERQRLRGVGRAMRAVLAPCEIRRELVMLNVPPAWVHHVRFEAYGVQGVRCKV
jgi:phosphatidylethanolamine/phosphatidyl-N-methylethanolamine N-methyltransferase